ncbi:unnamed protein product [Effrenium voratum]|nr:unnamed protein product [Effrenium voratum]
MRQSEGNGTMPSAEEYSTAVAAQASTVWHRKAMELASTALKDAGVERLLDIGSSFNPLQREFETVTAVDAVPAHESVLKADFLEVDVREDITEVLAEDKSLLAVPAEYYDGALLAMVLRALSPLAGGAHKPLRREMLRRAALCLRPGGLLVVIERSPLRNMVGAAFQDEFWTKSRLRLQKTLHTLRGTKVYLLERLPGVVESEQKASDVLSWPECAQVEPLNQSPSSGAEEYVQVGSNQMFILLCHPTENHSLADTVADLVSRVRLRTGGRRGGGSGLPTLRCVVRSASGPFGGGPGAAATSGQTPGGAVEYTVELQEAYRHLRVEHSVGEAVQAKAMVLSQGKRGIGSAESRQSCLQGLHFDGILDWAEPEETEEPKAEPKPAEPKVLSAPEVPVHSLDLMQARSQDSDAEPQAAEPASDEALEERSLLDSCRSVTSPEHSQAEHSQGPAELTEVHVSASGALLNLFDSSEDSAALAAKRERMARQMERRRQARAPRGQRAEEARRAAPAKREEAPWSAGARSGAQTARNPNSVRPGEIMEFPKATASSPEDEPQAVKDPEPQATPAAQEAPRPTPCQPAGPQAGPTLHARFEGLRDEMKRRRSQHSQHLHAQSRLAAPLEAGAVAEAKTSTASQPSQPSFVPAETPRSRSPEALTASASFTPGQVSPTSARARVPHIGGRSLPHLGLLAGGPSMVTSCRTTGSLSPGGRNYRDDVGWWASGSGSMSVTATPRVCGFTWREDAPVVLSSSVAVPGDLDRSRRHLTYSRSMSLSASSSASALARPAAEDHDVLHDAVQRFCAQQPLRFPLSRVSRGVYLYGNKKLLMALHNGKLMVRVGSGFKTLESCIGETRGHEQVHSMRRMSRT